MKTSISRNKNSVAVFVFVTLTITSTIFLANVTEGYPVPHTLPDVDVIYPKSLPEVDAVYPKPTFNWGDRTVLTVGDSLESKRLFSIMLRHLMPKGAKVFIETRDGDSITSWLETNRLKRMIRKHRPDNIAIMFDIGKAIQKQPERMKREIGKITQAIAPMKCYWFGPMSLLESPEQNSRLAEWVSPCTYIDPRVVDPKTLTKNHNGFSKTDTEKWAEKMWNQWLQAFL